MEVVEKLATPRDVPSSMRGVFERNYDEMTHGSGHLMLFAGDQKVEHLNKDFSGPDVSPEDADPEHLFQIASRGKIGAFATQLGLIARYGTDYTDVPYVVKLNSKTNLVKTEMQDPLSAQWLSVEQVVSFAQESHMRILGVGYTVYLGSRFEPQMLHEAAQIVFGAHRNGLVTILWMYPRGEAVKDELDPDLVAGAAGVAACLGSDFAKINAPKRDGKADPTLLQSAVRAAGRTKVICAGGSAVDPMDFLRSMHDQLHIGGTAGSATGRNIHQRSLEDAVRLCNAIYSLTVEGAGLDRALQIERGQQP